jgi:hypothetical protein
MNKEMALKIVKSETPELTADRVVELYESIQFYSDLLDEAMSLLMNHDQHKDKEWIEDYESLLFRYKK